MKHSQRITACALIPILLVALTACPASSKVGTYIDLAVLATTNGLKLAQSFGAPVTDALISEATRDGADLKNAYNDWASAHSADKWAAVQAALDAFEKNLPQLLNDAHVTNPVYAGIVEAALQAINFVVSLVKSQNPTVTGTKSAPHFDEKQFKSDYNGKMTSAGHPELQLQ